ncbi:hypothetical protein [Actinoallomurus iriomotensis]|uniref:Uncharacterized protein n=1 Tax=Actinoallomurus iriomotensis TaxID=478107 RepID=A0A9W6VMT2_9ACTN|nr:hypothetical protein [Actinoallomurus iriomotensis]GLY74000.1 hypothetical protein Airi01_022670 [Actinoallomurus iriomotensis]
MRHARDEVTTAVEAATRILSISGRSEPPEFENPDVSWGELASEGVWAPTRDGQRVHIGVAGAAAEDRLASVIRPSMRVFPGLETETDVIGQTTTAGVRFITVLHGPGAPEEFRFPLRLGEGLSLDPTPSGGYDVVHDRYGATVGRFYSPWGYDSLYRAIPAEYHLEGTTIVMTVRHRDADALYPVLADPHYAR